MQGNRQQQRRFRNNDELSSRGLIFEKSHDEFMIINMLICERSYNDFMILSYDKVYDDK